MGNKRVADMTPEEYEKYTTWRKLYAERNGDKIRSKAKARYYENHDKELDRYKTYREANREKVRAATKKYQDAHREEMRAKNKEYHSKNAEAIRARKKSNFLADPDKARSDAKARRNRDVDHTREKWRSNYYANRNEILARRKINSPIITVKKFFKDKGLDLSDVPQELFEQRLKIGKIKRLLKEAEDGEREDREGDQ